MGVNSLAILSERRFLAKIGLGSKYNPSTQTQNRTNIEIVSTKEDTSVELNDPRDNRSNNTFHMDIEQEYHISAITPTRMKIIEVLSSIRTLLRLPLILVNLIVSVLLILLG